MNVFSEHNICVKKEWDRKSRKEKICEEESLCVTEEPKLKVWKVKLGSYVALP